MESKESARLKDIDGRLKGIELQLREQNKQLRRIADIFDKQWHGDATATINDEINKDLLNKVFGIDSDD